MWDRKFLQGKLLTQIIENDIFDLKQVEEASKVTIDWKTLIKIFKEYSLKPEIILSCEEKVEITINLTKKLLSDLTESFPKLPKTKGAMIKKIYYIIRQCSNLKYEPFLSYKDTLDTNDQVKIWVFNLLQNKNIIICTGTEEKDFIINKDQMLEYKSYIENNLEVCKQEALKMNL